MKFLRLAESVEVDLGPKAEEIKDRVLSLVESESHVVIPKIEAIHAHMTKNYVSYPQSKLRGNSSFKDKESGKIRPTGVHSWTSPYLKPMLKNHNIYEEPLGRIIKAEYKAKTSIGIPGIICYPRVTDPEAIARIVDGRYSTVSIGADTDAAICSICGQDILKDWCSHRRGQIYEGKMCYWQTGNLWFIELSYVNAPADEYANTLEVPEVTTQEFLQQNIFLQDLKEHKLYDLTNDQVFAIKNNELFLIPQSEFIQEYYYIPFNFKLNEKNGSNTVHQEDDKNIIYIETNPKGKDDKPINKMQTGTQKQAYYGHNLLHGWWKQPSKTNWTKEQIKKEHARVVRIILNKGWKHSMIDGLDNTLPSDLKSRSKNKDGSKK